MSLTYSETYEFSKDFKRLLKRYRTLREDLETAKKYALELYHIHKVDNQSTFVVPGLITESIEIYKLKKFACKSLKGKGSKSGIRVIYAFYKNKEKVDFIEIYYKGDKKDMDYRRAKQYLREYKNT